MRMPTTIKGAKPNKIARAKPNKIARANEALRRDRPVLTPKWREE